MVLHRYQITCHGDTYCQGHWCPSRVPSTALPTLGTPEPAWDLQPLPELPSHSAQGGSRGLGMLLSSLGLSLRLSQPRAAFLLPSPLPAALAWREELEAQKETDWLRQEQFIGNSNEIRKGIVTVLLTKVSHNQNQSCSVVQGLSWTQLCLWKE